VHPSAPPALARSTRSASFPEWDVYRDRYFVYELRDVSGGLVSAGDRGAVLEDLGYGAAMS